MKLSDGLSEFNERGVSRLTDAIDDVSTFITRARATVDVSRGYKSFSGLVDGTDGEVRFVYRTDSIGK